MNNDTKELLVDSRIEEVCDELFFLDPDIVKFWMRNEDFRIEYHRLYEGGELDGFYLFYLSSRNTYKKMLDDREVDPSSCSDFDFKFAKKSITDMKRYLIRGFDNRLVNHKLDFLIGRIYVKKSDLKYWFMVPEFSSAIEKLNGLGYKIDNRTVYELMKRIFNKNLNRVVDGGYSIKDIGFSFHSARGAIKALEYRLNVPKDQRVSAIALDPASKSKQV